MLTLYALLIFLSIQKHLLVQQHKKSPQKDLRASKVYDIISKIISRF